MSAAPGVSRDSAARSRSSRNFAIFAQLGEARAGGTSEGVAEVIFRAATDGTDQLRYLGTPDIAPLLDKRRGASEDEYIAFMRGRFAPTTTAETGSR